MPRDFWKNRRRCAQPGRETVLVERVAQELEEKEYDEHHDAAFEEHPEKSTCHVNQHAQQAEAEEGKEAVNEPSENCAEINVHGEKGVVSRR